MAFKHIKHLFNASGVSETLYTVPSGKEFVLLRKRARYLSSSGSTGNNSGNTDSYELSGEFQANYNGIFTYYDNSGYGNTPTYYCSDTGLYMFRRIDDDNHIWWIIDTTIYTQLADVGPGSNYYYIDDSSTSVPTGTWSSEKTVTALSSGGASGQVSFASNNNTLETINISNGDNIVNGAITKSVFSSGATITGTSTISSAMAELMGLEFNADTWAGIGTNVGSNSSSISDDNATSNSNSGTSPSVPTLRLYNNNAGCDYLPNGYEFIDGWPENGCTWEIVLTQHPTLTSTVNGISYPVFYGTNWQFTVGEDGYIQTSGGVPVNSGDTINFGGTVYLFATDFGDGMLGYNCSTTEGGISPTSSIPGTIFYYDWEGKNVMPSLSDNLSFENAMGLDNAPGTAVCFALYSEYIA